MVDRSRLWNEYKTKIANAKLEDQKRRAEAWLSLPHSVLGQKLVPLTLRKLILLEEIESPLLDGSEADLDQIISFLWICSDEFCLEEQKAKAFRERIKKNKPDTLVKDLEEYLTESFAFVSSDKEGGSDSHHFASSVVDLMASEYGWSVDQILDMPLTQTFQLLGSINMRYSQQNGKQHIHFNPTVDKLKQEYLRQVNKDN